MKKFEFQVPEKLFGDFTGKLETMVLRNQVLGRNEDNEIEIEVYYENSENKKIDDLEKYLNELIKKMQSELDNGIKR
jgi:hypothetical protein